MADKDLKEADVQEESVNEELQDASTSKVELKIIKEINQSPLVWTRFIDYLYGLSIVITIIIVGFAVFAVSVDLTYMFILVVFGLIPAMMTYMIDMQRGKFLAKSVLAMNLAGIFPLIIMIIKSDSPYEASQNIVYSMRTWVLSYSYAALGWWISAFFPSVIKIIIELNNSKAITSVKKKQQEIIEEWGNEVRVGAFDPELYRMTKIKRLKEQLSQPDKNTAVSALAEKVPGSG